MALKVFFFFPAAKSFLFGSMNESTMRNSPSLMGGGVRDKKKNVDGILMAPQFIRFFFLKRCWRCMYTQLNKPFTRRPPVASFYYYTIHLFPLTSLHPISFSFFFHFKAAATDRSFISVEYSELLARLHVMRQLGRGFVFWGQRKQSWHQTE